MIQKMAKTDNESGALFEVNMKFDINVRSMRHTNFLHPGDLFCTLATYLSKHGASTTDRLDDWICSTWVCNTCMLKQCKDLTKI